MATILFKVIVRKQNPFVSKWEKVRLLVEVRATQSSRNDESVVLVKVQVIVPDKSDRLSEITNAL